ncbi:MAG TPA: FtsQ-type POTRA domain-containing protein [Pyrinomonadaceae bacterium]|nr:FtsQ-type POTRA domain-containing protein [Pyrinomonadaceae bacterium]
MREQVVPQRVGKRAGMSDSRRQVQRPVRRARARTPKKLRTRGRHLRRYVPLMLKLAVLLVIGLLIFSSYRAAASASFFQLRKVEVQGSSRSSVEEIENVVRRQTTQTGVWNTDLDNLSAKLRNLSWVRRAVVTRVLPDGIRVRIEERVPRLVTRLSSGHLTWVDDDAVLLGQLSPADSMPPFFLLGLSEEQTDTAARENIERVQKFLELEQEWTTAGLAERVSEVNLIDVRDVRAQLGGEDSQIEVRLGSQDLTKRLKRALDVLDGQRQTPRGNLISYVDLSQGKRAVIGFVSGARALSAASDSSAAPTGVAPRVKNDQRKTDPNDGHPASNIRGEKTKKGRDKER